MKPDWDKLMTQYKGDKDRLIADVDCTGSGKPLCDSNKVQGFPTIKSGDPSDLQDYKGGRDFKSLKAFAETLGPVCGPDHKDLCDEKQRKMLDEIMSFSEGKLAAKISKLEAGITTAGENFKKGVDKLQANYKSLQGKKEEQIETIKKSGLNFMKAVRGVRAANGEKFTSLQVPFSEQIYRMGQKNSTLLTGLAVALFVLGLCGIVYLGCCGSDYEEDFLNPPESAVQTGDNKDDNDEGGEEEEEEKVDAEQEQEEEKDLKSKKDE